MVGLVPSETDGPSLCPAHSQIFLHFPLCLSSSALQSGPRCSITDVFSEQQPNCLHANTLPECVASVGADQHPMHLCFPESQARWEKGYFFGEDKGGRVTKSSSEQGKVQEEAF